MAGSSTDVTLRKEAEQRIHAETRRDALTGLGNRTLFVERISRALRRGEKTADIACAIILLDLDRFTQVNESFGPQAGDEMLKKVAGRLTEVVEGVGLCVRLGGDEFAVLLEDEVDRALATRTAGRLHEALGRSLDVEGTEVFTTISCGIRLADSTCNHPGELLRDAEIALHRAKQAGRARFVVFDASMHKRAVAVLKLQNEMRKALERGEFGLHFQPIVSTRSQMIAGFEALVRWQHPERGMVPPLEFIAPAEDSGFIIPLGHWIMREACKQLGQWSGVVPGYPLTISVNLSGKQFREKRLAEQIALVIEETGIDPQKLKLEITESVLMEDADQAVETLNKLRDLGIRLQVDDFGSGYSSLAWLHRLPVNALKIDKSFIDDMETDKNKFEMVKAIRMMARNLRLAVVAEGVEKLEQMDMLKELSFDYLQGYYISAPVDAEKAGDLLKAAERY
jgi:diguanylate cyclase (GGDEF)-like protein